MSSETGQYHIGKSEVRNSTFRWEEKLKKNKTRYSESTDWEKEHGNSTCYKPRSDTLLPVI